MAGDNFKEKGFHCRCPERLKALKDRNWIAIERRSGGPRRGKEPIKYTLVHCRSCGATGTTRAPYADELPDGTFEA